MLVRWLVAAGAALAFVTTTVPGVAQAQTATGSPPGAQNLSANPVLATGTAGWKIVAGGPSCTGQQTCRFRNIYPGDRGNRAMVTYYRDPSINGTGVVHVDRLTVSSS